MPFSSRVAIKSWWVKLYFGAWRGLSISGMSVVKTCTWASILKLSGMGCCSVRRKASLLHHGGPHVDIRFEPRVEFLRRPREWLTTQIDHALPEIGIADDRADVAVEEDN